MSNTPRLAAWLDTHGQRGVYWYAKRLSANDTLATGAHQAGPYIPKKFLNLVLPALRNANVQNPDAVFPLLLDSHGQQRTVRAIWYNNRLFGGTRNEARITNFGGRDSPLLDPESTGSLALFAFRLTTAGSTEVCNAWVCDTVEEEDLAEERLGVFEPGRPRFWTADDVGLADLDAPTSCWLRPDEIPPQWQQRFPTGAELTRLTIERCPGRGLDPDDRLLKRRDCEYELFRSVEQAIELPAVQQGFASIEDFVSRAQTILQRRKARAGRSLELHTRQVFLEAGLVENQHFSAQVESELGKTPDFLFPSGAAYQDPAYPSDKLRLLAIKTTCKDRWRQVLNEADRIERKHLLTLQEGVSSTQFREMTEAGIQLVVPRKLIKAYPESIRGSIMTVGTFLESVSTR